MDIYEIAKEATEKAHAIPYGDFSPQPKYDDFDDARKFGRAMATWKRERDAAQKQRDVYSTAHAELDRWFKSQIAEALGLTGHPKFDLMFRIAWDEGHSSGYNEVAIQCDTLAELLQP